MNDDIAFIVLIAGTSVKGIDIIKEQTKMIMKANNASQEEIDKQSELFDMIYNSIKTGEGWDKLKVEISERIIKDMDSSTDSAKAKNEEFSKQMAEMQIKSFSSISRRIILL
jgi:50S ribosomal subunit-associated GTPase HflX